MGKSYIHFHGELKDFLGAGRQDGAVVYPLNRRASVKDVVEALGPPHTEVGSIRVQGREVGFSHLLQPGEVVDVHALEPPVDPTQPTRLRPQPYPGNRFVVDVNVGKLARLLRLLGYDASYDPAWRDRTIAAISAQEKRIVLTRDRRLLKRSQVVWGRLIRTNDPKAQLREVVWFYGLTPPYPAFSRCLRCNVPLERVDKAEVLHRLEPKTRKYFHIFSRCPACDRIYWAGSHHDRMQEWLGVLGRKERPE